MLTRFYSHSIQRFVSCCQTLRLHSTVTSSNQDVKQSLRKSKTPTGKLDYSHRDAEKEPLKSWPNNTNPITGEVNGPSGPEPTRYGDWERKGKCVDF